MLHDLVVEAATMFSVFPDHWSVVLLWGEVRLNGDGSFITGGFFGALAY